MIDVESDTKCYRCEEPIDGERVWKRKRADDAPVAFHPECWSAHTREIDTRHAREIERRLQGIEADWQRSLNGGLYYEALTRPPRWEWARFDNAEFRRRSSKRIVGALERWTLDAGSLFVSAKTGTGKTAGSIARLHKLRDDVVASVRSGESVCLPSFAFITGPELSGARRRAKIGAEAPLVELAENVRLLVLDEVGHEPPGEELFYVLDRRYRAALPTIITTGLKPAEWMQRYGDAKFRRQLEPGAVVEDWP